MKRKYLLSRILCIVLLTSMFIQSVSASDNTYNIDEAVQQKINTLIEVDSSNEFYFTTIIEDFYENVHTNSYELNQMLLSAIDSLEELEVLMKYEKQEIVEEQEQLKNNAMKERAAWEDLYASGMGDYLLGVAIVRNKGCTNTADYMEHAIVPMDKVFTTWEPTNVYHNNDTWAKELTQNQYFTDTIFPQFEEEILETGKSYGTITGSFAYTSANSSLDAFAALHNVNYSVTFTEKSSGGYSVAYKITDVYDFAWGNYDSFAIGFGNNYCYAMQSNGWIKPFDIIITASE